VQRPLGALYRVHHLSAFGHHVLHAQLYRPALVGQFVPLIDNLIRVFLMVQKGTLSNSLIMRVAQLLAISLEYDYFAAMPMFKRTSTNFYYSFT
jgi:hypothetical protein